MTRLGRRRRGQAALARVYLAHPWWSSLGYGVVAGVLMALLWLGTGESLAGAVRSGFAMAVLWGVVFRFGFGPAVVSASEKFARESRRPGANEPHDFLG